MSEQQLPLPDWILDPDKQCKGHCGGPLECGADNTCFRCGYDNARDRRTRPTTRDVYAQDLKYARGGDVIDDVDDEDYVESDSDSIMGDEPPHPPSTKSPRANPSAMSKAKKATSNKKAITSKGISKATKMRVPDSNGSKDGSKGSKAIAKLLQSFPNMKDNQHETDAAVVRAHCTVLLIKMGCRYGDADGNAHKYAKVVERMMKDEQTPLVIKSQFNESNTDTAQKIANRMAIEGKRNGKNAATAVHKLARNYMCAFHGYCKALVKESNGEINIES